MRSWLIEIRKSRKIRQDEVAAAAGIARGFYSQIETGRRNPSPKIAKRLAAILDFDWTRFYEDLDV